jgi:hypothetical protein
LRELVELHFWRTDAAEWPKASGCRVQVSLLEEGMYESRKHRPVSRAIFVTRLLAHVGAAIAVLAGSLALGMLGYSRFEHLSPVDAFLNSAMLLGGMGPVNLPATTAGKLFAGGFALYAGLVFIVVTALILTGIPPLPLTPS